MNKEKQIEEMKNDLNKIIKFDTYGFVDRSATAEALYDAGYRKQKQKKRNEETKC